MISIGLYVGESTGLEFVKYLVKKNNINYLISTDEKYKNIFKVICKKNNIKFFSKKKIITKNILKLNEKTDVIISVFSRYIFPKKLLLKFKGQIFNVHPGILPFYAGTNSISGTIYNNEKLTGVTIHRVTSKIDGGDIAIIKKIRIADNDLAIDVWRKLRILTIKALKELLIKISKNKITLKKNNIKLRKKFPKYIPYNGLISNNMKFKDLIKIYKAGYYYPYNSPWGSLKIMHKKKSKLILKIKEIKNYRNKNNRVNKINENCFVINLGNKTLKLDTN